MLLQLSREILDNDSEFSELLNSFDIGDSGDGGGGVAGEREEGDFRVTTVSKVVLFECPDV